jgi:hypothetical protein
LAGSVARRDLIPVLNGEQEMTETFISNMKGINPHTDDNNIVTFEVLTVVTMKITVSWDVTSCSWDVRYQGFGENCCLSLQG